MPTKKTRRCTSCGNRCSGQYCEKCWATKRREIPPCVDCGVTLHRRSTPQWKRVQGSRFLAAHSRCSTCLTAARAKGTVPPPTPRDAVRGPLTNPGTRIFVKAQLSLEDMTKSLCHLDDTIFFSEGGPLANEAKRICRRCPIRERCLEVALANNEQFGVFGGLTASERKTLRISRQRAARREARR